MKIAVTGGLGFIGRRLCAALVARGDTVTSLDVAEPQAANSLFRTAATSVRGDLRDRRTLDHVFAGAEAVVHLGAITSVAEGVRRPDHLRSVNIGGTEAVFSAATAASISHVIVASSAAVYGDRGTCTCRETDLPSPLSVYGQSKLATERIAEAWRARGNGWATVIRPFNVYGPGQRSSGKGAPCVAAAIAAALEARLFVVRGTGSHVRDFVHVDDLVTVVLSALSSPPELTSPINVATGIGTSVSELLREVERVSGARIRRAYEGRAPSDITYSRGSQSLLAETFPDVRFRSLTDGLSDVVDHSRKSCPRTSGPNGRKE